MMEKESGQTEKFANRYELLSSLGSGAMGKVYLARDNMLTGEIIALKVLNPGLSSDANHAERFFREVKVTRLVTHKNVVRTFDAGQDGDQLFFTMEYIEGVTLRDLISHERLSVAEIVRIMREISDGLAAIHHEKITHRDLKSANIMMTNAGLVKIADFGVAKPKSSDLTSHDEVIGSATHLAPECWKEGTVDALTDIYAFGVVAYELVTGTLPFNGKTPGEVMFQHINSKPRPPQEINPEIPPWLSKLILSMMAKDRLKRPPSANEILSTIERITEANIAQALAKLRNFDQEDGPEQSSGLDASPTVDEAPEPSKELSPYSFGVPPATLPSVDETSQLFIDPLEEPKRRLPVWATKALLKTLKITVAMSFLSALIGGIYILVSVTSFLVYQPDSNLLSYIVGLAAQSLGCAFILSSPLFFLDTLGKRRLSRSLRIWVRAAGAIGVVLSAAFLYQSLRILFFCVMSGVPLSKTSITTALQSVLVNAYQAFLLIPQGLYFRAGMIGESAVLVPGAKGDLVSIPPYYLMLLGFCTVFGVFLSRRTLCLDERGRYAVWFVLGLPAVATIVNEFLSRNNFTLFFLPEQLHLAFGIVDIRAPQHEILSAVIIGLMLMVLTISMLGIRKEEE